MAQSIRVRREVLSRLTEEAQRNLGEEVCGLLAGRDGIIMTIFPATNAAVAKETSYEIAPEELFRLMREIRAAGLELLGIYHSHPRGENVPSTRDIERAYYPDAAYFILSPQQGGLPGRPPIRMAGEPGRLNAPRPVRAYFIRHGRVSELTICAT